MIKKLLASVREYKKPSILAPIYISLEVVMEVVIPLLMAKLIDNGLEKGDLSYVFIVGGILVLCTVISLLFGVLSGSCAAEASAGFAKNLRHDMFKKVQTFSFSNIDKFSTAGLVTRLTTDTTNLQNAYQMIIRTAVRSPFMLIFSLAMAFSINGKLAWVFIGAVPILGIGLWIIMSKAHPTFKRVFKTYDRLNRVVQENLRGVRVVKAYVRGEHEKEKFETVSQSIYEDFSYAEKVLAFNQPIMQFCMYAGMLLISWLGALLIVDGDMKTGELMSLLSYAGQILMSLMMLSMIFVMITMSRASAERIVEVLDEQSEITNPEDPVDTVKDGSIVFENVSFSYSGKGGRLALKDASIRIESGMTVGILGGTGSAKSTLAQLVPRLYDATEGRVLVGGVDVRDYDLDTLRDNVAMVLQKNVLFSGTIKDNLRWGNKYATDEQMEHACKLAQADGFIKSFPDGYDTYIEQGGTNVSGGQKQRLCIARALLKNPKILILDDSTSAVDTATDGLIRKAFAEYLPDTTKLIIAQRVSSVENADLIIVMDKGRISASGTHEQLLEISEIYREVYETQTKGGDDNGAA
ncbi:MAG: ABC transporter ATP-binding protein [Clostridia bacterium]|nr:ABC transporter ATP-binding protein [Clostridia bacterium]